MARPRRLDATGFFALIRPRIAALVLVVTAAGYLLEGPFDLAALPWVMLGTLLVAAAGCALNHYLERDVDARMHRTRHRPLVTGALTGSQVLAGASAAAVAGLLVLALGAGPLATALEAAALVVYLGVYTPLKRRTSSNTWVGAIPGALPLLVGAAAAGGPSRLSWLVFGLIFLWQLPHFFAIASIYRQDYLSGGVRMLSGEDPEDASLRWQMPLQVMSVMLISVLPVLLGPARAVYAAIALPVGLAFLAAALAFRRRPEPRRARRVVLASVLYLPIVLSALVLDVACSGRLEPEAAAGEAAACCELDVDEAAHADHVAAAASGAAGTAAADGGNDPGAGATSGDGDAAAPGDGREVVSVSELLGQQAPEPIDDGTGLPNHGPVPAFSLVGDDGKPFTQDSLAGSVWVVDFIFTNCAGPCIPMAESYRELQKERLPARFLSVTVDPRRDSPEALSRYRDRWGATADEWRLLTGTSAGIQDLAEGGFKLPVNAGSESVAGMPPLFHSGKFALVDRNGFVRGYYDYRDELELDALRRDIAALADVAP